MGGCAITHLFLYLACPPVYLSCAGSTYRVCLVLIGFVLYSSCPSRPYWVRPVFGVSILIFLWFSIVTVSVLYLSCLSSSYYVRPIFTVFVLKLLRSFCTWTWNEKNWRDQHWCVYVTSKILLTSIDLFTFVRKCSILMFECHSKGTFGTELRFHI